MGIWSELSQEISQGIERVAPGIVAVQGRGVRTSSGLVWSENTIVTAAHAVRAETGIEVWTSPERPVKASLAGRDRGSDVAALRTEAALGAPASFAPDPALRVGQLVVAVGRTRRGNPVASAGILSGLMGEWHSGRGAKIERFIRPDLALYPGFSGGGLLGADGKLIGMTTSGLRGRSPLALPYVTLKRIVGLLLEKGYVPGPYLGMGLQPVAIPESLRTKLNLSQQAGGVVVHLDERGPAVRAGLLVGDLVLQIAGQDFHHAGAFPMLASLAPGQAAEILGIRGGDRFSSTLTVGERPRR